MLTLIATGVVIGIIWIGRRLVSPWWAIGLGMVLGGALGNLVDRFFRSPGPLQGHVVDFLSIGWWPVFNVADPAVVGGAILLVVLSLFGFDFDTVGRGSAGCTENGPLREAGPLMARPGLCRSRRDWRVCGSTPVWPGCSGCREPRPRRSPRTAASNSTASPVGKSDRLEAGAWLRCELPEAAAAGGEHAGRHRGHDDPLLRRRHRRRRQATPVSRRTRRSAGHGPTVLGGLAAAGFRITRRESTNGRASCTGSTSARPA